MNRQKLKDSTRRLMIESGILLAVSMITVGVGAIRVHAGPQSPDTHSAEFTICGNCGRVNCVVDGDTFWFRRQKIRLADIDAPELSPPRCQAERLKGEAAKRRLLALLNEGKFSIAMSAGDVDRYGRKLRIVTRQGRSIGLMLVEEGLAREWSGPRRHWCD